MAVLLSNPSVVLNNLGSNTLAQDAISPTANHSSDPLIITANSNNRGVLHEHSRILEQSETNAANSNESSQQNNICHSKAKFVKDLNEWCVKHDVQPDAFRDLLEILSTYYPELELVKEFEGSDLLKGISSAEEQPSGTSKRRLCSEESNIADASVSSEDECDDDSKKQSLTPSASKRRKVSASAVKSVEFIEFKEDLLNICQMELRTVCQEEFSKWNKEFHDHLKIVKGMATDLKQVKEELMSVKEMLPKKR